MKVCNRCNKEKPLKSFNKSGKKTGDGVKGICKNCERELNIKRFNSLKEKKCNDCGIIKPIEEFWTLSPYCKDCAAKRQKKHRSKNLEEIRKRDREKYHAEKEIRLQRRIEKRQLDYGLSLESGKKLFESCEGKCSICKTPFKEIKDMCLDHDHNTMKARGYICNHCNFILGHAMDDISILESAIEFLKNPPAEVYFE